MSEFCEICGDEVEKWLVRCHKRHSTRMLCRSCGVLERIKSKEERVARLKNEFKDRKCAVCGGAIPWKDAYIYKPKPDWPTTCCRTCHAKYSVRDMQVTHEEAEKRLLAVIEKAGHPLTYQEAVKEAHIASKVLCKLQISVLSLNKQVYGQQTDRTRLMYERAAAAFSLAELCKRYNTSAESHLELSMKLRAKKIPAEQWLQDVIKSYIDMNGHYIGVVAVMKALSMSYDFIERHLKLSVEALNVSLGYRRRTKSWYEYEANAILNKIFGETNVSPEHVFMDCRSRKDFPLRFDFFIPAKGLLIEVDGSQYINVTATFYRPELFENDRIKDAYAARHGYKLLRISTTPRFTFTSRFKEVILDVLKPVELLELLPDKAEDNQQPRLVQPLLF